jgi:hypothetical protein
MVKYCKVDVCGYNTLDDKYWGKKFEKGACELYFQITVKNLGYNNSNIVISPTFGSPKIIIDLCATVKKVIRICEILDYTNLWERLGQRVGQIVEQNKK